MYKTFLLLSVAILISANKQACCDADTLSITGAGSVEVDPDTASFSVTASEEAKTSFAALSQVNLVIRQIVKVLAQYGLSKQDYSTSQISISPQYDYNSGKRTLRGQRASQTLRVTIDSIQNKVNAVGRLVSSLSSIKDISISGLSFQNSDPRTAYRKARWAAVDDAKRKAKDYAQLSGKVIGGVKRVIDQNRQSYRPFYSDYNTFSLKAQTLQTPYGKVQAQSNVEVVWRISN